MNEPEVTGFTFGRVTAQRQGDLWTFTWRGRERDDGGRFDCSYPEAVHMARELDSLLEALEPYRREYESRRGDITQTLVRWQQERQEAQ